MQRLLTKIKLTKRSSMETANIERVEDNLQLMRVQIYVSRLKNPKKFCPAIADKISDYCEEIGNESDTFKTFGTLTWLFLQLRTIGVDQMLKSPEKSLPTKWKEASRKVREGPFLKIVDQILEALEDQETPHSKLAHIACECKMEQNCTVCEKEIIVTGIWSPPSSGIWCVRPASVCIFAPEDVTFSCGSVECRKIQEDRLCYAMWNAVLSSTVTRLSDTRCDFCFLCAPLQEVHRSLCKTKNYCSKTCRSADNDFNQVCCKQKHPVHERKVKVGGQAKVEVADANLKQFASNAVSFFEASPQLLNFRDFNEALKYDRKLMEKMQLREEQKLKEVQDQEVKEVD